MLDMLTTVVHWFDNMVQDRSFVYLNWVMYNMTGFMGSLSLI